MAPRIHILRPGTFRSRGVAHTFSEADIRSVAGVYDPAKHEAPIVVGHPRDDTPAFGWVGGLVADTAGLHATPRQIAPAFAEAVESGRYKKVSAAFYGPGHPSNPAPGSWYLRHVGFLGGQPPEVKGLQAVQLADDGADCAAFEIELSEGPEPWTAVARLFRGVREWILSSADSEAADRAVPDWEIDFVSRAAEREPSAGTTTYSEPSGSSMQREDTGMTDEERATQAAKDKEIADLTAKLAKRDADAKAASQRTAQREAAEFAERMESEGRILPRDRDTVVSLQMALPEDSEVEFSESGDGAPVKKPAREALRDILSRAPVQVDFSERAPGGGETPTTTVAGFDAPDGYTLDADSAAIHNKAVAFAEKHNVDYETAVMRVASHRGATR